MELICLNAKILDMDYFGIINKKLMQYKNKYSGSPAKAYLKLISLSVKMLIKEVAGRVFKIRVSSKVKVSIVLWGGIGDILNGVLYSKHLIKNVDLNLCDIDIFVPISSNVVCDLFYGDSVKSHIKNITLYKASDYDLQITLEMMFPRISVFNRAKRYGDFLSIYLSNLIKFEQKNTSIFTDDRQLNQLMWMIGSSKNRLQALDVTGDLNIKDDWMLTVPEYGFDIINKFSVLKTRPFVTISRGVDKNNSYKDSTRLWSVEKYEQFIQRFKNLYPEYLVVYLGSNKKDCKEIKGVDIDLVGKTTMAELMAILKEANFHFDMECGMVHLRHFLCKKTSIVLFGPTSPLIKSYPENINIRNDYACSLPMCEHILLEGEWSKVCLKNKLCRGQCIESISVDQVIEACKKHIENLRVDRCSHL